MNSDLDDDLNSDSKRVTGLTSKKGKTFTVLFKNTDQRAARRSGNQLESPGLHRDASKDEHLRPGGMVESARYDVKEDQRKEATGKKSPARVHKINILQNLNSNDTKDVGVSSHNVRLSARQQLLSISVKNIELPSNYQVSP